MGVWVGGLGESREKGGDIRRKGALKENGD